MNYKVGSLAALISHKEVSNFEEKNLKVCELIKNENSSDLKRSKKEHVNSNNRIKKKDHKINLKRKWTDDSSKEDVSNKKKHKKRKNSKNTEEIKQTDKSKTSKAPSNIDNESTDVNKISSNPAPEYVNENDPSIAERTVFVGNWPIKKSKKSLKNLFSQYGNIESIRFRSIPIANSKIPKKVLAIKKQFHPNRTSMNAYVKFSDKDSAAKALDVNGTLIDEHHLRITLSNLTSEYDHKKSIFIGNIDFQAEEEDIWKIFSKCGEIDSVRLIRDNKTGVSRGIGYVNFKKTDSVELALKLTDTDINGRVLRIKRIHKNVAKQKNKQDSNKTGVSFIKKQKKKDFQGTKVTQKKDKKKKKKIQEQGKKKIIKKKS